MSQLSKPKASPAPIRPLKGSSRRPTRWWAYILLILALALAWPAYRYNMSYRRLAGAQEDMAQGKMSEAISKLEAEAQVQPQSGKVAYWLAVAHRRAGHIKKFNEFIEQAKNLSYSPEEIHRQVLLSWLQSGETSAGIETQADRLIEEADHYSAGRLDLFVDEFFEARALGFLANFQLINAELTLDHWIEDRPKSIPARLLRANVYERQQNRYQAAEQEYRDILELEPGNLEARVQFARLLLFNQQVPDAAAQYEICLKSAPEDVRAQLGLAECEYRGGKQVAAAQGRLEKLLLQKQSVDDRAKTLFLLGEIARFQGKHELVVKYLTEATELSPLLGAAPYRSLSSAYAGLQQREQAEKYLAIATRKSDQQARLGHLMEKILQDPENGSLRFEQGELLNEEGNRDQAAIWWNMAVRFDPDHLPAHASLAEYYTEKKDQKLADYHRAMAAQAAPVMAERLWKELTREEFAKVQKGLPWLAHYPDLKENVEILSLGLAVVEGKNLGPAVERLQQLADNPQLKLPALTLLGDAQRRLGNFAVARQALGQALIMKPDDGPAHWGMQNLCRDTGSFTEMEAHVLKVVALDANDFRPHRALGELHKRNERWTQAVHEFQESLRLKADQPDKDDALLDLAECLTKAKKFPLALTTLKDIKASPRKAYVEARCRYESQDVERAKQVLDSALKISPDHLPFVLLRADIALASKEVEVAKKLLSHALQIAPQSSEPHRKYAALLRQKGETDVANAEDKIAMQFEALESQLALLIAKASQSPTDVSPRQELAAVAKKLGRDAEASHWEAVVKGMSATADQPGARAALPIAAPTEKQRPIILPSPPAINAAKPDASKKQPKPCGEEMERRREGEKEKAR